MRGAILALLAAAMGTGIFNLPLRVSQIGVIPFIFFVFAIGLYSYFGMTMISEIITRHKVKSYSDMT
jgi:amino acid permease